MNTENQRKQLEDLNSLRQTMNELTGPLALELYDKYSRSEQGLADLTSGDRPAINEFREAAKRRVQNDLLIAHYVICQEGKIPPSNAFHGRDEIVRSVGSSEGDREVIESLFSGAAILCVHSTKQSSVGDLFSEIFDAMKKSDSSRVH